MKNKIHSLIVEGIVFCGSGLVLLSYSLSSYAKGFNKSWAQSPYLFPIIVALAMIGLSLWIVGEGVTAMKKAAANSDDKKAEKAGKTEKIQAAFFDNGSFSAGISFTGADQFLCKRRSESLLLGV